MKTFFFSHKNSNAVITLTAPTFIDADAEFIQLVKHPDQWRVDDEDGLCFDDFEDYEDSLS